MICVDGELFSREELSECAFHGCLVPSPCPDHETPATREQLELHYESLADFVLESEVQENG